MASEYDQKFEEMKKYIPFLENMIARLESSSSASSNPRQAQLDKIKSLRDLLQDKKKRMKMENLLKCEQVLINLYAKVEQKDTLHGISKPAPETHTTDTNKSDLDAARNKLKSFTTKNNAADTLPEIARASDTEEVCTPGSKEPALFQRRPNRGTISPRQRSPANSSKASSNSPSKLNKRNYTRVLLSPEPSSRRYSESKNENKQLFVRQSPQKYLKKERKNYSKEPRKLTLKVSEDSVESLNTKDIVTRILNCSDGDVDIDTLREIRSQIIGELKDTGTQDDISDLILKSYKHKKKSKKKQKGEIEEGELSDSESEAIGSIYGNLTIIDEVPNTVNKSDDNNPTQRKIQISLTFNPEFLPAKLNDDELELENCSDLDRVTSQEPDKTSNVESYQNDDQVITKSTDSSTVLKEPLGTCKTPTNASYKESETVSVYDSPKESTCTENESKNKSASSGFQANFYKPLLQTEKEISDDHIKIDDPKQTSELEKAPTCIISTVIKENVTNNTTPSIDSGDTVKSKSFNNSTVSEIDILQALKNDILNESLSIPGAETATPTLHQPKITKVANNQETITKKRISIEKYKAKTVTTSQSLFVKEHQTDTKKTSLKLTEKEFERFKLDKLSLGDSSDDDVQSSPKAPLNFLAPRSPDNEDKTASEATAPVIIPENPLKTTTATPKTDVDMRQSTMPGPLALISSPTKPNDDSVKHTHKVEDIKNKLLDPRMRRDLSRSVSIESPNPHLNSDRTSRPSLPLSSFPNLTPQRVPFEMTPSQQFFDDQPIRKHIYAPGFPVSENLLETLAVADSGRSRWEDGKGETEHVINQSEHREKQNVLYRPVNAAQITSLQVRRGDVTPNHSFERTDAPTTPIPSFGGGDAPLTPSHSFSRGDAPMTPSHSFNRVDAPMTPSHSFGRGEAPNHYFDRGDAPMTPSHSFGRDDSFGVSDAPMTPSHSFGRGDTPMTPSHSSNRSEASMTPSHPFGKSDGSMTPTHSFGRSDAPMTASNHFGRNEMPANSNHTLGRGETSYGFGRKDPRLNRTSDYDKQYNERGRYQADRNYDSGREYNRFAREQIDDRNKRNDQFIHGGRSYHREYIPTQRQSRRDYEGDRLYTRDRGYDESFYKDIDQEPRKYEYRRYPSKSLQDDYQQRMERTPSMRTRVTGITHDQNSSIGRKPSLETISVKPPSDRSFNIDTSISNTFQMNIKTKPLGGFNDRRRRAASVGRTVESSVSRNNDFNFRRQRATSVGRTLKQDVEVFDAKNIPKRDYFHRACSVGRDLNTSRKEKSWSEIKADFASYKLEQKQHQHKNHENLHTTVKSLQNKSTTKPTQHPSYSPKKNSRDPRVRKEHESTLKSKGNNKYNKREHFKEEKSHGIVYSSHNIAQGKILGPGYGVKNYKIPKIKRLTEEIQNEKQADIKLSLERKKGISKDTIQNLNKPAKENHKDTKHKNKTDGKKDQYKTEDTSSDLCSNSDTDARSDRVALFKKKSSSESNRSEIKSLRKPKKAIIQSDSDEEEDQIKSNIDTNPTPSPRPSPKTSKEYSQVPDTSELQNQEELLESSFGLDDIEIFPENMVSDPVLNNIDDLIANLDNDLTNSKMNVSFKDTTEEIYSAENRTSDTGDSNLAELTAFLEEQINKNIDITKTVHDKEPVTTSNPLVDINIEKDSEKGRKSCSQTKNSEVNTQMEQRKENNSNDLSASRVSNEFEGLQNVMPDSTVSTIKEVYDASPMDKLPDSTHEIPNDSNSISSTLQNNACDGEQENAKSSIGTPDLESIENILTILQNKDKIKQLINMLGNQDPNNTIKKKLTKLSEIVESVDEDTKIESQEILNTEKEDVVSHLKNKPEEVINPTETEIISSDTNISNQDVSEKEKVYTQVTADVIKDKNDLLQDKNEEQDREVKNDCFDKQTTEDINVSLLKQHLVDDQNVDEGKKVILEEDKVKVGDSPKNIPKGIIKKSAAKKYQAIKKGKSKNLGKPLKTRVTRANVKNKICKAEKKKTELQKLQDDLKEMFLKTDILNSPGIRMCRLAKMTGEHKNDEKEQPSVKENEPFVVLQKTKNITDIKPVASDKPLRKKPGPKPKLKAIAENTPLVVNKTKLPTVNKPGPKSKTKRLQNTDDLDPFVFDTDSTNDTSVVTTEHQSESSSDSEIESNASSISSIEPIVELMKKVKRRRGRKWQSGIIKTKNRKIKPNLKLDVKNNTEPELKHNTDSKDTDEQWRDISIPDLDCFTDTKYCFVKGVSRYHCRLCHYIGKDIVSHYKTDHPHSEVPLSRLDPDVAREAIIQCEMPNFQAISKMSTNKYVCRFCFREFRGTKNVLERFFWHIASVHTGEYRQVCSECVNMTSCPMNLDIIPPPKDTDGQLIGYICEKCNYTQISLENLKHHVISRHDDQQTVVYTINLAMMTNDMIESLSKKCNEQSVITKEQHLPTVRSSRSSVSLLEASDARSDDNSDQDIKLPNTRKAQGSRRTIQSKISFENDDNSVLSETIKMEPNEIEAGEKLPCTSQEVSNNENVEKPCQSVEESDVVKYPHFKIYFNDSGSKEYVCCINGTDNHYKTTLLISMKKHIQTKHTEIWDGYCFICRAVITPQGQHLFKECFQHCLDNHIDNFPILENLVEDSPPAITIPSENPISSYDKSEVSGSLPARSYINVRPLAELLPNESQSKNEKHLNTLPKIESVVSLGSPAIATPVPQISPTFPFQNQVPKVPFVPSKYEEAQAEIMSKKHRVVLEAMMAPDKLARIFKCAGRFCSFSTDSADEALLHASTHAKVGGENALKCAYCDFDNSDNAIDLVTHIFKMHATCFFFCRQCFYRAGSSQLVGAHIERYHKQQVTAGMVLKSLSPSTNVTNDASEPLPRKIAVPFYVCNNGNSICNFKTYTPGKFTDHLIQKHGGESTFPCSICQISLENPLDLVKHLKTHGLMRYQCTWCVFGADNETDLISHASEKHPAKQPQGYLRIITNKEGTNDFRVLPLANLNKLKVAFQEVTPSEVTENPMKEAERSIELEALIGSLNTDTPHDSGNIIISGPSQAESGHSLELDARRKSDDGDAETVFDDDAHFATDQLAIKSEVSDTPAISNPAEMSQVICLDSDDDESPTNTITVQKEPPTAPQNPISKKVLPADLFQCPKCRRQFRNRGGFGKHLLACSAHGIKDLKCLHCSTFITRSIKSFVSHLHDEHLVEKVHTCSVCYLKLPNALAAKKHIKMVHKVDAVSVKTNMLNNISEIVYTPLEPPPKATEPFRPQDVALLPINPIFDYEVKCAECEFSTKVRLNMVRHLQQHAQQQPAAATAPVNPVPVSGERYFDKMLNLASSSIASQRGGAAALAGRYPRFVPERTRRSCGAPGCDYISVDDAMLRRHWDTLHAGATHYRCLHCPPTQQLDTSQPLTATRILAHLKMHDETLYACSECIYHHFRRRVVDKHISEVHSGTAQVIVVREEAPPETPPPVTTAAPAAAPTMDLKPWHCGVCEFKSMLRQQVAEHCSNVHRSKMQYKCSYCPYRASTLENVTKHQSNSHPLNVSDIFYYYYKEGSTEDDAHDGVPRWVRQRQNMTVADTDVKQEMTIPNMPLQVLPAISTTQGGTTASNSTDASPAVDLNIVKYEPRDDDSSQEPSTKFVQFCDPNGLKYKCPFCKIFMENTRETMQSHLFEELKYRRWSCGDCSYKAFHRTGLNDHMITEHSRANIKEPVALPVNTEIETWVTSLLEHQSNIITKNRDKLMAQRIQTIPTPAAPMKPKEDSYNNKTRKELEQMFGPVGAPVGMHYSCPKCQFTTKDETVMQNHLESELNKIRWSCSCCSKKFVSYHEAQFHGKEHREPARPLEVSREPRARAAWLQLVLRAQRGPPAAAPDAPADNDLLAVRYERPVPTPEEESLARRKRPPPADSDDEDRLLIDEGPAPPRPAASASTSASTSAGPQPCSLPCPHCSFRTVHAISLREHILRHYKLKPYKCGYCDYTGYKKQAVTHCNATHASSRRYIINVAIPDSPPLVLDLNVKKQKASVVDFKPEQEKLLCLICDKILSEADSKPHTHPNEPQLFAKKNEVVVKCCRCTRLHKDVAAVYKHSSYYHPDLPVDYVYHKLTSLLREYILCSHCNNVFNTLKDLLSHHHLIHKNMQLNYKSSPVPHLTMSDDTPSLKRKADDTLLPQIKRTARKSTSKLPKQVTIAKKSTTKLPLYVYEDSDIEEYSYYGTKPAAMAEYEHVTTMMPFCNRIMPFKLKQLKEIIQIEPLVLVADCMQQPK